ncbi:hypothetical protein E2C01_052014 [Portunus trituberculatus]|uniref:Uncharacterized protein n=1 Tax=Portunus trituberculatus TaxID=210409 RepID=A0A5B7GGF9_PORTR|nr:hypothetical protein [Portunus trituberculatus]
MKWTEDLPLDIENIRHEECEGYSSYYDVSDMENGRKRKKRKTKQKEYGKDKDNEENAGNMGHECEGEPSYYGASDMDNGSERKKKWTKQKEYERETMDNNQETSGNIRHEVYGEERYFTVSEENAEFKASQHEKDSPYNVETIWHSSSNLTVTTSKRKRTTPNKRALSQYSSRPSKRQKVESSRLSSECSTPSDQNFSITVCNQIESLSNIRITLCRSPGSDGTASMDRGIKVQVQFSDKHSVTGGGELCTPVTGQDGSVDLRQSAYTGVCTGFLVRAIDVPCHEYTINKCL